jgi:membrane dipeptidase
MSREFHDRLIVIDALEHSNWDRELFDELHTGGVTAVHVTLAVWEDARTTLDNIGRWYRLLEQNRDILTQARSGEDIASAKATGKTAVIFGFQNSSPIENDLALVRVFHELGIRIIQLTYNNQSLIGSGCYERGDGGLTRFGREVIKEMNRLGMLVDLSHCNERTTLEAIESSERPVAVTHSNPKWFHNGIRNKSDDVLRALARRDGMLGLSLYPFHIGGSGRSLTSYCEMVKRVTEMIGPSRVGFGTDQSRKWSDADLDWIRSGRWTYSVDFGEGSATNRAWPKWPEWFQTPADFPRLTEGLLAACLSRDEVAGVMGGNWLRFFTDAFRPAQARR